MIRLFAPVLILSLSACGLTTETEKPVEPVRTSAPNYSYKMKKWIDCNLKSSQSIAQDEGEPSALAMRAYELCREEEATFEKALAASFRQHFALKMIEDLRPRQIEANVSVIVNSRIRERYVVEAPEETAY